MRTYFAANQRRADTSSKSLASLLVLKRTYGQLLIIIVYICMGRSRSSIDRSSQSLHARRKRSKQLYVLPNYRLTADSMHLVTLRILPCACNIISVHPSSKTSLFLSPLTLNNNRAQMHACCASIISKREKKVRATTEHKQKQIIHIHAQAPRQAYMMRAQLECYIQASSSQHGRSYRMAGRRASQKRGAKVIPCHMQRLHV